MRLVMHADVQDCYTSTITGGYLLRNEMDVVSAGGILILIRIRA